MLKFELMNAVAQSLSLTTMLLHYESGAGWKRKMGYFLLCLALDSAIVISGVWLNLSLLLHIPVLAYYMNQKIRNLPESFLNVLIVINLFVCSFSLFGSILFLLGRGVIRYGFYYNLSFCIATVVSAFAIRCFRNGTVLDIKPKTGKSIVVADIFLVVFFIFCIVIMPRLPFAYDSISYASVQLMFLMFILFLYIAETYILKKEKGSERYKMQCSFLEREMKKYKSLIKLKHFLLRFMKACSECVKEGDIDGFISVVNDIIEPASSWLNMDKVDIDKLSDIHYPTIRQLILQVINEAGMLPQVDLKFDLTVPICGLEIKEGDLFQVLSILFDNALDEVMQQKKGFLHILITKEFDSVVIIISNSKGEKKNDKTPYSFGQGLNIVLEIIAGYKGVDIVTRISDEEYIQRLSIKRVC